MIWARFSSPEQMPEDLSHYEKVVLPLHFVTKELLQQIPNLLPELPAVVWPLEEEVLESKLQGLKEGGLQEVLADNIYAIPLCRRLGLSLRGGAGLNVLNSEAIAQYEEEGLISITASFEADMKSIKAMKHQKPLGIMAYGRLPLMRFRNCPLRAHEGCKICGGKGELKDRKNVRFPIECCEQKYSTLLNSVPLHIADRNLEGLDYLILYFTRETKEECKSITEDYLLHQRSQNDRTGGLYYRELL